MHGPAERTDRTAKNAQRRTKYTSYHTMLGHSSKRIGQCIYAIFTVIQAAFVLFSMDHRVNDCTDCAELLKNTRNSRP